MLQKHGALQTEFDELNHMLTHQPPSAWAKREKKYHDDKKVPAKTNVPLCLPFLRCLRLICSVLPLFIVGRVEGTALLKAVQGALCSTIMVCLRLTLGRQGHTWHCVHMVLWHSVQGLLCCTALSSRLTFLLGCVPRSMAVHQARSEECRRTGMLPPWRASSAACMSFL